jgi:hypothetical protein
MYIRELSELVWLRAAESPASRRPEFIYHAGCTLYFTLGLIFVRQQTFRIISAQPFKKQFARLK